MAEVIPGEIVVIGAGLTAANAVETLRAEGYDGALTVVGAEPDPPYERPQLSKEFLRDDADFASLHEPSWYQEKDARLLTGVAAARIDRSAGKVDLADGRSLSFDAVLLATGAQPRTLDVPGTESAYFLRTVADARRLKAAFTPGHRIALIGGGWIGLEVAAAARAHDVEAVILEVADLPLQGVLGTELAQYLLDLHRAHGVEVRTGVTVRAVEPDGVVTSDGREAVDAVVVAVGAVPETSLAHDAGLQVALPNLGKGVVVDEHLRTSDPRVYAAGDLALARHTIHGPLRVEHWDNAIRQGQLAARTMLGQDAVYEWQPYFYTDQFEFSMEYVGHSSPTDEVVIRGDRSAHEFIAYWLRDGVVTAGMNVGIWDVNDRLRELVGTKVDAESLTDLR